MYFEHKEALETPRTIVHEEAVGKHAYTVLLAIRDEREAETLGWFAAAVAKARGGGLLAAHMLEVPQPLSLNEGRMLIKSGRSYFETIRSAADARKVATHSVIMIARRVANAVQNIAAERSADFIVLGWSGETKRGRTFGRTIDPLLASPPADMAIVRPAARRKREIKNILVPVDAGANSRLAIELACDLGRHVAGRAHAAITLLRVTRTKTAAEEGETALFERLMEGVDYGKIETKAQAGTSEANTILETAEQFDLIIFGANDRPPLNQLFRRAAEDRFSARTTKRILREAKPTTVMVKRRAALLRSFIQRTLLPR
jgi:nucleotide-binding universal stress UspA family protein